jgi:hypothetical protein
MIDLDGVNFVFSDSLKRYLEWAGIRKPGEIPDGETPTWNFFEGPGWNMTLGEFLQHCNDAADAGFLFAGPTREGALEMFDALWNHYYKIVIITDRPFGSTPEVSRQITRDWLEQHSLRYHQLIFSADKTCAQTDYGIEDKIENYDALDAVGTKVYLINRPWNQVEGGDSRRRVNTLAEFTEAVLSDIEEVIYV